MFNETQQINFQNKLNRFGRSGWLQIGYFYYDWNVCMQQIQKKTGERKRT